MQEFYNKLSETYGIDNIKDLLAELNNLKEQKQELINKKYPINKEDILMFSNIFYDSKLELYPKAVLPSQYITQVPETLLIPYGNRNEIVNDVSKTKMILFFKLLQRGYIILYLTDYKIYNNSDENNKIKELLEEYRIKKGDSQNEIYFTSMGYGDKDLSLWGSIKNRFLGKNKTYKLERNGVKFFMNDLLDNHMEEFIENLDYGIDFNIMMFDKNLYVGHILLEITKFISNINKSSQINKLFNEIKEQIGNKANYSSQILLSYPLSDYIDSKNHYMDIITELHDNEYLTIKELYIYQSSVNFVIEKINRFDENIINKLIPLYERLSFKDGNLKLDDKILISGKKENSKIYEIIDIIVDGIKKYQKLELTYNELKIIFSENEEKYSYIFKTLDENGKYSRIKQLMINEMNEKMKESYKIELDRILNKVFNIEFFNSSLSKDSKKEYFIIKNKTTGLANLC